MCGRTRLTLDPRLLRALASKTMKCPKMEWDEESSYTPSYNAAPGNKLPVASYDSKSRRVRLQTLNWGLTRGGSTNRPTDARRLINARSETYKTTFRGMRRGVLFVNGFYEWNQHREPFYIFPRGVKQEPETELEFGVLGAYGVDVDVVAKKEEGEEEEEEEGETGMKLETECEKSVPPMAMPTTSGFGFGFGGGKPFAYPCLALACLISQRANSFLVMTQVPENSKYASQIHHRVPVLLDPSRALEWLLFGNIVHLDQSSELDWYRVSSYVNSFARQGKRCCEKLTGDAAKTQSGIMQFFKRSPPNANANSKIKISRARKKKKAKREASPSASADASSRVKREVSGSGRRRKKTPMSRQRRRKKKRNPSRFGSTPSPFEVVVISSDEEDESRETQQDSASGAGSAGNGLTGKKRMVSSRDDRMRNSDDEEEGPPRKRRRRRV